MPQTAQINLNLVDETYSNRPLVMGLYGIMDEFPMGPVNKVSDVISSFDQFKKIFGDVSKEYPAVLQAKLALEGGASLRVYNIGKLKDQEASCDYFKNSVGSGETSQDLFNFYARYEGLAYNRLVAFVTNAASGRAGYFDVTILLMDEYANTLVQENYVNLHIPAYDDKHYLDEIENNSKLVHPQYATVTSTTSLTPVEASKNFSGAFRTNGVGAYSNSGDVLKCFKDAVDAFDNYDDIWGLCYPTLKPGTRDYDTATPDVITLDGTAVLNNLLSKVNSRKGIRGMIWVGDGQRNTQITNRKLFGDTEFVDFFGGDAIVLDPITSDKISVSPMGPIVGIFGYSDSSAYPWYSAAGVNRGKARQVLDVTYNYGIPSNFQDLNELALNQINTLVQDDYYGVYLSGNFTGQLEETQKSFTSIMKLWLYIKRTLRNKLLPFIEEPLDLILVKDHITPTIEKEMRDLNSTTKRALQQPVGFKWNGDQDVNKISDMVINDPIDFQNGKYKGILQIQPVNSLQVLDITVSITNADVDLSI